MPYISHPNGSFIEKDQLAEAFEPSQNPPRAESDDSRPLWLVWAVDLDLI